MDIEIVFTSVCPGEKLFEELLTAEEGTEASKHEKIFVAQKRGVLDEVLEPLLNELFRAAEARDAGSIRAILRQLIPS